MNVEELVNKNYDRLNSTDLAIWKYMYNNKEKCTKCSINEIAKKCNVSRTTIMRFAQKISLEGFSELKVLLKNDIYDTGVINYESQDICKLYNSIVSDLQKKNYTKICEIIHRSNRIFAVGTGAFQKNVIQELKRMFFTSGKYIIDVGGTGAFKYLVENINHDDAIIVISMSGERAPINDLVKQLKLKDVPIISITKLKDNTLAFLSDDNIYISTKEYRFNVDQCYPFESGAGFFMAIELLYMEYQNYESACVKNHVTCEK